MTHLDFIREQIKRLYKTNPNIHLNVSLKNPRITLDNTNAKIIGVYPHIFQIEEYTSGKPKQHTLQYTDVFVRNIVIWELENGKE